MTSIYQNPEISIILINITHSLIGYFLIYPKLVKSSLKKLFIFDISISLLVVSLLAYLFYQKGIEFNALIFRTNWFWFWLLTASIIGGLAFHFYKNKYDVSLDGPALSLAEKLKEDIPEEPFDQPNTLKYMRYILIFYVVLDLGFIIWALYSGEEFQLLWGIDLLILYVLFLVEYPKDKATFFLQSTYLITTPCLNVYGFIKTVDVCDSSFLCLLVGLGPSFLLFIALIFLLFSKNYYFNNEADLE